MENARRWSGYVCPDCRFVFRVPQGHDGKGVVCPCCRRLLRIPGVDDTPPALMARPEKEQAERPVLIRRARSRGEPLTEVHSWEQLPTGRHRSDSRSMRLMLIGGAVMLALIIGGVVVSMNQAASSSVRPPA